MRGTFYACKLIKRKFLTPSRTIYSHQCIRTRRYEKKKYLYSRTGSSVFAVALFYIKKLHACKNAMKFQMHSKTLCLSHAPDKPHNKQQKVFYTSPHFTVVFGQPEILACHVIINFCTKQNYGMAIQYLFYNASRVARLLHSPSTLSVILSPCSVLLSGLMGHVASVTAGQIQTQLRRL